MPQKLWEEWRDRALKAEAENEKLKIMLTQHEDKCVAVLTKLKTTVQQIVATVESELE